MVSPPCTYVCQWYLTNINAGGVCAKLLRTHARSFHYQLLYEVRFTVLRRLTPFDTTRFWLTVTHIVDSAHDMYPPPPPFPRFRSFMKLETNDRGELEFEGFMRFCTTTLKTAAKNQRLKADSVASEADVDGANA